MLTKKNLTSPFFFYNEGNNLSVIAHDIAQYTRDSLIPMYEKPILNMLRIQSQRAWTDASPPRR